MIDLEEPEPEPVRVLAGQAISEARRRRHFQIVEDDNCPSWRLVQSEKQGMLALRRIRGAVDEDEVRLLQAEQGISLRGDVERLDGAKAIPAAG